MKQIGRVQAKNIFFGGLPLIIGINKVNYYLEVKLTSIHNWPNLSNTLRFNMLINTIFNEIKNEFPDEILRQGDIVYGFDSTSKF